MRHYEIVLLVHPEQNDQVGAMMERYRAMVSAAGGTIHHSEDWGRRQLASPVQQMHKARYLLMSIECDAGTLGDLEQVLNFNDAVLRHLVIARRSPLSGPSLLAQEKKERDRKQKSRARAQHRTAVETTGTPEAPAADAELPEAAAGPSGSNTEPATQEAPPAEETAPEAEAAAPEAERQGGTDS